MAEAVARKAIPWDEAVGPHNPEDDRASLEPGCPGFYITDVFFSEETRFGKIAKINAIVSVELPPGDLTNIRKYRTTAKALVSQLEKVISNQSAAGNVRTQEGISTFKIPAGPVTVINYQPVDKMGKSTGQAYYKLVAAEPAKV
jgi:hypothetical protein